MRTRAKIIFLAGALLILSLGGYAQTLNYKMGAMFVYNFTKYIQWPPGSNANEFVIGVYGSSPFTSELNNLVSGKRVGQRTISVITVKSTDEALSCQILIIPASQAGNLKKIVEALKGKPVLIVCESEGSSKKGASISLFLDEDDDGKTKFEINKSAILGDGLILSQSLLGLAAHVY